MEEGGVWRSWDVGGIFECFDGEDCMIWYLDIYLIVIFGVMLLVLKIMFVLMVNIVYCSVDDGKIWIGVFLKECFDGMYYMRIVLFVFVDENVLIFVIGDGMLGIKICIYWLNDWG